MTLPTLIIGLLAILTMLPTTSIQPLDLVEPTISVIVKGEVQQQTIEIHPQAQIKDIIDLVTLTPQADLERLDFNQPLYDDMVITIPKIQETSCISINQANLETLMSLDGIGESTAQNIIDYRESQGPFYLLEDLLFVKNIGPKKYEKIKDKLCL